MNTVKVRNIVIGEGMPKICVPIVGVTKEAILEEAKAITKLPADVVEWRIDWFENVFDFAALEDVMKGLREVLGDTPILMTFRTSKEGGEKAIEDEVYADINIKAAQTGYVDMVDVEVFTGDEVVKKIIDGAHAAGVKIAVMPQNKKDVLTLLAATEEMANEYADRPIITMSMAGTGVISRLAGEVFGSALTFGAAAKASAPGQMGVQDLKQVLTLLHGAL